MAQYSEKVMQHFMNPKNVGEIPDADGIGTVGNPVCGDIMTFYIKVENDRIKDIKFKTFGCLPPTEKVTTNSGEVKEISNIHKGDKVLNSLGESTFVVETYKRNFSGELLKFIPFVSSYNTISLTENHPVLCIKRKLVENSRPYGGKCNWLRLNEDNLLSTKPDFIWAKEIEVGDYLIFVSNKNIVDNKIFTKPLMRLLGYYLSEGYISANGNVVCFAFNKKEKKLIEEVNDLIFSITGKKAKQRIRDNVFEIYVCSKKLADFVTLHCGKYAKFKKLSEDIILLPFEKQWQLLETYHLGDGDKFKRRNNESETYRIITTSEILAVQIQQILARGSFFASIKERLQKNCFINGRKLKESKQFLLSFKLSRKHKFVHFSSDGYFLIPLRKIEKVSYSGEVLNFQVAFEPNTYLVKGFAVHNCGAAIAVSSMTTELAIGKTLDEAMKITRDTVAKELGGLPSNKMHCSNLGADALHAAIEDYRKKQKQKCICPFCENELRASELPFCKKCNKKFISCPKCKKLIPENSENCPSCGEKI